MDSEEMKWDAPENRCFECGVTRVENPVLFDVVKHINSSGELSLAGLEFALETSFVRGDLRAIVSGLLLERLPPGHEE